MNHFNKIKDTDFWKIFSSNKSRFETFEKRCKWMFTEYGTSLVCNRFDIGNCVEYGMTDLLKSLNLPVKEWTNEKRIDLEVQGYDKLSIKYSSCGNIKLHNSLGENKDFTLKKTILITPSKIFLIDEEMCKPYLDIKTFLKNTKDGLELKRSILTQLSKKSYPYSLEIDINVDKKECKNQECARVFWNHVLENTK